MRSTCEKIQLAPGDVVRSAIFRVVMQRNTEGLYHGEMIYDHGYQVGRHSMLDPAFILFSCLQLLLLRLAFLTRNVNVFSWLIFTMRDSRIFSPTESNSRCAITSLPFQKCMVPNAYWHCICGGKMYA